MRERGCLALLVAVVLHCPLAPAQPRSPYHTSWSIDGPIAGAGVLIGAGALVVADDVAPLTVEEISALSRDDVNPFDRGATYNYSEGASSASDWVLYASLAAPLCLLVDDPIQSDWQTYLTMYAETMALTTFSTELVKGSLPRTRPFAYNSDAPAEPKLKSNSQKSFYSSHASSAFASAVFLSTTFGEYFPSSPMKGYVWAGSLLLATAVGSLRYAAGSHFPTDILVGAAMGSAIGYLIPLLHRTDMGPLSLLPSSSGIATRLEIVYRF